MQPVLMLTVVRNGAVRVLSPNSGWGTAFPPETRAQGGGRASGAPATGDRHLTLVGSLRLDDQWLLRFWPRRLDPWKSHLPPGGPESW